MATQPPRSDQQSPTLIDPNSRYALLKRGDFGGTDLTLIFVEDEEALTTDAVQTESASQRGDDGRSNILTRTRGTGRAKKGAEVKDGAKSKAKVAEDDGYVIRVHRSFLWGCDLVRRALASDSETTTAPPSTSAAAATRANSFAEARSGEIHLCIPRGTMSCVDHLLEWCYDGRCGPDASSVAALWVLADFLGCPSLAETALAGLRNSGRRSEQAPIMSKGSDFAAVVAESFKLGAHAVLEAALDGAPLQKDRRDELEDWLDYGSPTMLAALAECVPRLLCVDASDDEKKEEHDSETEANDTRDEENEDPSQLDTILDVLGDYLVEMRREDRAKMNPTLFARCLARLPLCSIAEAEHAALVLNYIEDRERFVGHVVPSHAIHAFLASVDFGAIDPHIIRCDIIPRLKDVAPSMASAVDDVAALGLVGGFQPVITRCRYSGMPFASVNVGGNKEPSMVTLKCGHCFSADTIRWLFEKLEYDEQVADPSTTVIKFTERQNAKCPLCFASFERDEVLKFEEYSVINSLGWRQEGWGRSAVHRPPLYGKRALDEPVCLKLRGRELFLMKPLEDDKNRSRLHSYQERKSKKLLALKQFASSTYAAAIAIDTVNPVRQPKRVRRESPLAENDAIYLRIINQCSTFGYEEVLTIPIDSLSSTTGPAFDEFASRIEMNRSTIRFLLIEGSELSQIADDITWESLEWDPKADVITARRAQTAGKPVIRLYSNKRIDSVEVSLELKRWSNVLTYPQANVQPVSTHSDGDSTSKILWRGNLRPYRGFHSSEIEHVGDDGRSREYDFLFWEAMTISPFSIDLPSAACVKSADLAGGLLQDALVAQGLLVSEATEMATHWLPALMRKQYVLIQFLPQSVLDERAPLTITPQPTEQYRVFMLFCPIDAPMPGACGSFVRNPRSMMHRGDFAVLEWGGMETSHINPMPKLG